MTTEPATTGRLLGPDDGELLHAAGGVINRILEDGTTVGQRIGVMEGHLPPGFTGPPQHLHRAHDETFYVVRGTIRFLSADRTLDVPAGGFFSAPIGTPHGFANASSDDPALMLSTFSPQRYVDYFRELQHLAAGPGARLDRELLAELMSRYQTELYSPDGAGPAGSAAATGRGSS